MPRMGLEPTISAGERPQTYAVDHAATGTGIDTVSGMNEWMNEWMTKQINIQASTGVYKFPEI